MYAENSEHEIAVCKDMISYQGQSVEIALNASYVNEILAHLKTDEVNLSFPNPLTGVLISPINKAETNEDAIHAKYIISKIVV